uniref:Reverse transcriptase/retrotransposon-derived protein RNase H-like domain-containing protein n=1 Tax=Gopherus agassizii TaxID=38772 RepID=A0A452GQ56_9SAUR
MDLNPLCKISREEAEEPLHPNPEQIRAFKALKESLIRAPALGLPNYSKPFDLYVHEVKGIASGVLTQSFGNAPRPVAYLSGQLDPVAKGHPGCLRNVAAAALLVEKAQEIVLGHPLTVFCLLHSILSEQLLMLGLGWPPTNFCLNTCLQFLPL